MIGLDTNVLVRYFVQDHRRQSARALALVRRCCARGEPMFIPVIALVELAWVLDSCYQFKRGEIAEVLRELLLVKQFEVEHKEAALQALRGFEAGRGDFADHLLLARSLAEGCDRVATFDRALHSVRGFVAL